MAKEFRFLRHPFVHLVVLVTKSEGHIKVTNEFLSIRHRRKFEIQVPAGDAFYPARVTEQWMPGPTEDREVPMFKLVFCHC